MQINSLLRRSQICFWSERQDILNILCHGYFIISASKLLSLSSTLSASSDISFCLSQVNGVNVDGLRHSEVVALIRVGGGEVRLLVVDRETDELFHRLGLTPTTIQEKGHTHLQIYAQLSLLSRRNASCVPVFSLTEVFVDESATESTSPTPPPTTELPTPEPPIINVTLTDSPITKTSPKSRTNGSSASQSSRSSTTQSEISSSDMSIQVREQELWW